MIQNNENIVSIELETEDIIQVKKRISLPEVMAFVSEVTESCVNEDTRSYMPEIREFCISCNILTRYAGIELPEDVQERYDFIYQTDITDRITKHIDTMQLNEILVAIDKKIRFMLDSILSNEKALLQTIAAQLNTLTDTVQTIFGDADTNKLFNVLGNFENFSEKGLVEAVLSCQKKQSNKGGKKTTKKTKQNEQL